MAPTASDDLAIDFHVELPAPSTLDPNGHTERPFDISGETRRARSVASTNAMQNANLHSNLPS